MSLKPYHDKRDFTKTAEPRIGRASKAGSRFVIQKHEASRLHYDLRLELEGVLKSWAVPKGPPLRHGEKRLAIMVEDHPVSYLDFEGPIPKGEYGGGTVLVWDQGTFQPLSDDPLKELSQGKLHFVLQGKKLSGEWYLVRLHDENEWLLVRGGADLPIPSKAEDNKSVHSGKTMSQLAAGDTATVRKKEFAEMPDFISPMSAKLTAQAPKNGAWIYEIKFDGFRALAFRESTQTRLLSRNNKNLAVTFPEVVAAVQSLKVTDMILDGEVVALDSKGRSSFQLLQQYEGNHDKAALYYYVFDILRLNGKNLQGLPLLKRKAALQKLLSKKDGLIRYSAGLGSDAEPLLAQARELQLEGLIGKKADSSYEAGRRSGAWIKLKLHAQQEFVIGGFTEPEGSRKHLGALIIGVYRNKQLIFCGKVGTGFSDKVLKGLHVKMEAILADACPFSNLPAPRASKWGQSLTASEMIRCHWVKPSLVAQVKFSEWTRDDHLRHPVFLGLREDKNAKDVVREEVRL